jgi:hypothetical protein
VTPGEVYERTLRAMVTLIQASYGPDAVAEFGAALDGWERERDVSAFLRRVSHGGGMGSYYDGHPAIWDEEQGSYVGIPWVDAAYDGLRSALAHSVREVAAAYEHAVEWVAPPVSWLLTADRCSRCGLVLWVENPAQRLWKHFAVHPAASVGRAGEIVEQALTGGEHPACRAWTDAATAAFERAGLATGTAVTGSRTPCPRCGADERGTRDIWIAAPPVRVEDPPGPAEVNGRPRRRAAAADAAIARIEDAFVAHWSLLGQWPGARLVDDRAALRFETPIRKLPYNGVIRTAIFAGAEEVVPDIVDLYRRRAADVMWVVHPTAVPASLDTLLEAAGLAQVERAVGMSLDLDEWSGGERSSPAELAEVVDEEGLRAYVDVSMGYWQLDEADRDLVLRLNSHWSGSRARGRRWLALLDGRPVGKG